MNLIKNINISLLTLLVLGGCSGEAKFENECALRHNGEMECSVRNIGTKEGSVCIVPRFYRLEWNEFHTYIKVKDSSNVTPTNKLCTNLIKPLDMQIVTKVMRFSDEEFKTFTPFEFCGAKLDDYWNEGCMVFFEEVP